METARLGVTIDRALKNKAEAVVVAAGMTFSEYVRRVFAYAAEGGDLSVIAPRPSGIHPGRPKSER
jgi:antitoxin component of RelBE/YafQ-DinJ toxin-antitoxin module